jgi:hypothetical protein
VLFAHTPHPYTVNDEDDHGITAEITSLGDGGIAPGTPTLHFRLNGGSFQTLALDPTANPDEYAAAMPAQPWGTVVEYYLTAENDAGEPGACPRQAPDICHYFRVDNQFDDALEWDTAWSVGAEDDNATTGIWTRADPNETVYNSAVVQPEDDHTADPGVACYVTGNGPVGGAPGLEDVDDGRTTLFSPRFDLTGGQDITIGYWRYYTNNLGYNPGEDIWRVDVSNDAGASWVSVENTMTSSNAWQEVSFDLATHFAEPGIVQLRFIAEDAGVGGSLVEALVDDFVLTGQFGGTTAGPGSSPTTVRATLAQNRPNPFNPNTRIAFDIGRHGPASLAIYDSGGRLVDVLVDGVLERGEYRVRWDGTDGTGRPVASGVYFYVLETDEAQLTRRMTLIR